MARRPDEGQGVAGDMGDPMETTGGPLLPRWPLLSLVGCAALAVLGAALRYTAPAVAPGALAVLYRDLAPAGVVQSALVLLAFLGGWLVAFCFGSAIHDPGRRRSRHLLLRALSDHEALRPALDWFGAAGVLSGLAMLLSGRTQAAVLTLALLPGGVALWARAYRPPASSGVPASGRARLVVAQRLRTMALFRFRSLPLVRSVWPNRPPAAGGPR